MTPKQSLESGLTERLPRYSANPKRDAGFKTYEFSGNVLQACAFGELTAEQMADAILEAMPEGAVAYDMDGQIFRMRLGARGYGQDTYIIVLAHPDFPKIKEGGSFPPAGQLLIKRIGTGCKVQFIEPEAIAA